MDNVRITVFPTELGWMSAAWRAETLRVLTFGHASPRSAVHSLRAANVPPSDPDRFMKNVIRRLRAFSRRPKDDFRDIDIDLLDHTPFQRDVLERCRRIGIGETRSYGEIAGDVGRPKAARAVGQVMASNLFPIIVPCHRVVGANGSPGGFSAPDGLAMKRRLLTLEGACAFER